MNKNLCLISFIKNKLFSYQKKDKNMLRRSARLQEKALRKQAECLYPLVKEMEEREDQPANSLQKQVVNKLQRRNGVRLPIEGSVERDERFNDDFSNFIVYGVFKYEIGDKKAGLAKKRLNLFLKLSFLFLVVRVVMMCLGILTCK